MKALCGCCDGHGVLDGVDDSYGQVFTCPECLGGMWVEVPEPSCPMCDGQGGLLDGRPAHPNFQAETCPQCNGTGKAPSECPKFTVRDTIPIPDEAPTQPCITYLPDLEDAEGWS